MNRKYKIITLGCKVNQAESLGFERDFLSAGLANVSGDEGMADFIIVNTCCVTGIAERKSRKAIRGALKNFPGAQVWVTGCSVNLDRNLSEKIPGGAEFFLNEEKKQLSRKISGLRKSGAAQTCFSLPGPRAPLKVADGCNEKCAYCIVPLVRGPVRSRSPEEIILEAEELVSQGKKELILTAINLGLYGTDFKNGQKNFIKLIEKLSGIPGVSRFRLSSIEPMYFTDELIEFLLENSKVCPHFYIPLQSGSGKILKSMNRRYSPEDFLKIMQKMRRLNPEVSINTDVIVGFPGEDSGDFQTSYDFIKNAGFSRLHVFPYSRRPGTPAADLSSQVNSREIKKRVSQMLRLRAEIMLNFHKKFLGRTVKVLAEEFHPQTSLLEGLTGNYLRVLFEGPANLVGGLVPVTIKSAEIEYLNGSRLTAA